MICQAIFRRRRHQPRRPPLAKIIPGSPAPTMGAGTGLARVQIGNHAFGYTFLVSFSSADCCERRRCVPAIFGVRVAPARDEPRSGSNNSERGPTSGRSTNYGSGHLIRVFRDIGRIFSLLFLLSHPSPIGHPLRRRVQPRKREYGFVEGKKWFQPCFVWNSPPRSTSAVQFTCAPENCTTLAHFSVSAAIVRR